MMVMVLWLALFAAATSGVQDHPRFQEHLQERMKRAHQGFQEHPQGPARVSASLRERKELDCPNSDGLDGYSFSHEGFWDENYNVQGYMTVEKCAARCNSLGDSCVAISMTSGVCYSYTDYDGSGTDHDGATAYIKCSARKVVEKTMSDCGAGTRFEDNDCVVCEDGKFSKGNTAECTDKITAEDCGEDTFVDNNSSTEDNSCEKTEPECPNSDGLDNYRYSHSGYWEKSFTDQGNGTAEDCVSKCDSLGSSCVGFNVNLGRCFTYDYIGGEEKSDKGHVAKAYRKCVIETEPEPECPNSDGLNNYRYSHDGYWDKNYTKQGKGTAEECLSICDSLGSSCVGFNTNNGICYTYDWINHKERTDEGAVVKAYKKCVVEPAMTCEGANYPKDGECHPCTEMNGSKSKCNAEACMFDLVTKRARRRFKRVTLKKWQKNHDQKEAKGGLEYVTWMAGNPKPKDGTKGKPLCLGLVCGDLSKTACHKHKQCFLMTDGACVDTGGFSTNDCGKMSKKQCKNSRGVCKFDKEKGCLSP